VPFHRVPELEKGGAPEDPFRTRGEVLLLRGGLHVPPEGRRGGDRPPPRRVHGRGPPRPPRDGGQLLRLVGRVRGEDGVPPRRGGKGWGA